MLAAGIQAFGGLALLRSQGLIGHDAGTAAWVWLVMTAGPCLLLALMLGVDRWGLGSGFSVATLGLFLSSLRTGPGHFLPRFQGSPGLLMATCVLLVVLLLGWRGTSAAGPQGFPVRIPFPAGGIQGLLLPGLLGAVAVLVYRPALALRRLLTGLPGGFALGAVLCTFGLAVLYNRPVHVREAWDRRFPDGGQDLRRAVRRAVALGAVLSGAFAGLCVVLEGLTSGPGAGWDLLALVFGAAIGVDLVQEWRFRRCHGAVVPVWPLHRVHAAVPALDHLRDQEVPGLAAGLHHRSLLQFFGPMVPVSLLVPAVQAEAARAALEDLLGPAGPAA